MPRARTNLLSTTLLVGGLGLGFGLGMAPFAPSLLSAPAHAQQRVEIREEFRAALEPHGSFERHARYGEVWRPARVSRDWRPYTVGRWVYNDDLGWYWNADESEADWGWVAFHYGRWVNDKQMSWVWVPGNEWGPAWVNWRRGEGPAVAARGGRKPEDVRYIGWAPLPPDDIIVDYRDDPEVWTFVRARDIVSPRVNTVIIRDRRPEILQRTVVVNRTVVVRDGGVIVNPGIAPAFVAAFIGRPLVSYDVRPRVIVGTTRYSNAIEIRGDDLRDRRRIQTLRKEQPVIRESRTRIEAVRDIPQARALEANEQGRLGDRPPRAAQRDGDQRRDGMTGDRRGPNQQGPGERPGSVTQGQRDVAPGRNGATPGQAQTAPGRAGERSAPGQATPPGRADTAPGRAGEKPGQAQTAPGRQDRTTTDRSTNERTTTEKPAAPSRAGAAPGRNESTPGQAQTAPGRAGDTPGQSGAKPPGQAGSTPGQSGATPNRAADTPARPQERGAQQREERPQPNRGAQQREERSQPAGASRGEGGGAQRGENTGSTPNRGATAPARAAPEGARGASDGAREQRAPQRPEGGERRREAQ